MSWLSRVVGKLTNPKSKYVTPGLEEKSKPKPPPNDETEQSERRCKIETRLKGEGVPLNPDIPPVPPANSLRFKDPGEVAERVTALTLVAMKASGMDHDVMQAIVDERDAWEYFTPSERAFMDTPSPSEEQMTQFSHGFESAWALIWALRLVREPLTTPRSPCIPEKVIEIVRDTPDLAAMRLRTPGRLAEKLEMFQHYNWAIQQAQEQGKRPPAQLNSVVAQERFRAMSWLTCQQDNEDWIELDKAG